MAHNETLVKLKGKVLGNTNSAIHSWLLLFQTLDLDLHIQIFHTIRTKFSGDKIYQTIDFGKNILGKI